MLVCFFFIENHFYDTISSYQYLMSNETRHNVDYLIIGGGIAGTTAAEAIRGKDERGTIAILSKEPYELYSRVLLPKYVEGALTRTQVFLRTAEDYSRKNIALYEGQEATVMDVNRREVRTHDGTVFFYKQLLIAVGGRVKPWRVEGSDTVPVMRFHTIDDAETLFDKFSEKRGGEVVIVGGGFIALELVNALVPRGISPIHCIFPEMRYWEDYLDEAGSSLLERHLEKKGVALHSHETATMTQQEEDGKISVFTSRRTAYKTDILIAGVGLDREVEAFSGSGVEAKRGIVTNEFLETGVADVWAAGDVAEYFHPVFGKHLLIGNWNNAFLQGRTAGLNMVARLLQTGEPQTFNQIPLYAIDVLGMHVAFLGDVVRTKEVSNRTYVSRSQEGLWYERFGLENGKLVSAVFINKFEDKRAIEILMKEQRDCTPHISYLSDASVNLADVI